MILTVSLWSNHIHEDVALLNSFWYIIFWIDEYDEALSLIELNIISFVITSLLQVNCTLNLFTTIIILWTLSFAVDYLWTLWLVIFFSKKPTYFLNTMCHWSQPDALSTCFIEDFYFYMVWRSGHLNLLH